jgi:hypothetical protein
MFRLGRELVAAVVALLTLLIAHWFDAGVLADARVRGAATFDQSPFFALMPIAHLLTAAGVVALVLAAWWSRSLIVGVGYAIVGGVVVFLPTMVTTVAISVNDAPTLAPEPIATLLTTWFLTISTGVTGAVFTLGAAMLLSGLAVIVGSLRPSRATVAEPSAVTAQPSRPGSI